MTDLIVEELEDGSIFISHPRLPVHGYGENIDVAFDSYRRMYQLQWRNLVESDESTLTSHARKLRAGFLLEGSNELRDSSESMVEEVDALSTAVLAGAGSAQEK